MLVNLLVIEVYIQIRHIIYDYNIVLVKFTSLQLIYIYLYFICNVYK